MLCVLHLLLLLRVLLTSHSRDFRAFTPRIFCFIFRFRFATFRHGPNCFVHEKTSSMVCNIGLSISWHDTLAKDIILNLKIKG